MLSSQQDIRTVLRATILSEFPSVGVSEAMLINCGKIPNICRTSVSEFTEETRLMWLFRTLFKHSRAPLRACCPRGLFLKVLRS